MDEPFSWCCIENDTDFERNEDRATGFLKWTDFNLNICLAYDYDEQPERDTDNLYDIEEDKRAWNSGFNGGIGKRAWNSGFNGGVGKRAWNNFNGG